MKREQPSTPYSDGKSLPERLREWQAHFHPDNETGALLLEAAAALSEQQRSEPLSELIPTNWLDPLLTGPDVVIPKRLEDPLNHEHIAELLRRLKKRIQDAEAQRSERKD